MADPSLWSTMTVRGVCAILVVLLGQFTVGCYYTLNVTLVAMKATFNYSQTEVSLVMSSFLLGFGFGMHSGAVLDRIGPKWTSLIGIALTVPGLGLMYIASVTVEFFRDKSWLLAIFAFIAGQGSFVTFTVTWTTGARQADPRIRGILMGVFKALLLGSPVFFTLIYNVYFMNGQIVDAKKQNFQGYILFVMIILVIVDLLAICLLKDDNRGITEINNSQEMEMESGIYGTIPIVIDDDTSEEDKPMSTITEVKDELFSSDDEDDLKTKYKEYSCLENAMDEYDRDDDTWSFERVQNSYTSVDKKDLSDEYDQKEPSINMYYSFPDSKLHSECEQTENKHISDANLCNQDSSASSSDNVLSGKEDIPLMTQKVSEHVPFIKLLKTSSYNIVLWNISLSLITDTVIYGNIPAITQSVNLQYLDTSLMIVSRVCICSSAFFSGLFYNYMNNQRSIYSLIFVAVLALLSANTMMLISTEHAAILLAAAGLIGLASGILWVLGAGLVFSVFGPKDYGRNWGFVIMTGFVLSECVSLIFGKMYDAQVSEADSHVCYGSQCTKHWFILLLCILAVSFILSCWQLITTWKRAF
ncbi:uncharacterized protein [Haliotis cracherodii]|uniref:uncharacterized protein n=1 Tax=Haliotis cracherodii TaxID=6455 RepID=UPI0039ECD86F